MIQNSIVKGALILTIANIITRVLGFVYRIYMSNVIGAEGMGLYQLIVPIYMLVWSISSSGFSTTISKLTAQENAKNEYGNMGRILKQSIILSGFISLILSISVFLLSEYIGTNVLNDARTVKSLKIISLCFPFMAAGSCIRGYFLGLKETKIPAASQVLEQFTRMAAIYFLAGTLIPKGLEYAAAAAVIGMCLGEIISFIYVLFCYKVFKLNHRLNKAPSQNSAKILGVILIMAIPLTANRVTGSFLSTIENILIPQKLQEFGFSVQQSMSEYGKLTGMAMPLIMFPSSLLTALSTSVLPVVSEARAVQNNRRITNTVTKSMLLTSIIGIGTAGIFITFPNDIGYLIYNQDEIGKLLYFMGFICPFMYFQVTLSGILNGLGEQVFIFRNSLISSAVNIGFIYFLIPVYGINAFIAGWFLSLLFVSILDLNRVVKRTGLKIKLINWFIKPILSITVCCMFTKILHKKVFICYGNIINLILSLSIIGVSYILILIITNCLSIKDIKSIVKSI